MKRLFCTLMAGAVLLLAAASPALAAKLETGAKVPDFTGATASGKTVSLSDYEGRLVVLEWTNHECPFVMKHYDTGNMQSIQDMATKQGAVWLSVVSSAPGKQGHTTPEEAQAVIADYGSKETERILDESGEIGRLYGAKTTPQMFVIGPDGTLLYQGAIDSNPSARESAVYDTDTIPYTRHAIANAFMAQPIEPNDTKPYGCSVKY